MEKKCRGGGFLCKNCAHLTLLLVGAVIYFAGAFQNSLWFDEAYTVGLMNHSFFDMIKWAASDVHPHLYYIMLWIFTHIFGIDLTVMRIFSAIGAVMFASLGITHIRKDFGREIGFWFSFCAIFSGSILVYTNQIRMYTWAAYFVTLACVYAYRFFKSPESKKDGILFVITSVCAAYCHYFALFTVAAANAVLLYGFYKSNAPKPFSIWIRPAVAQVAAYIPGALVFLYQIKLGGASWITIVWPDVVFDLVSYHWIGATLSEAVAYKTIGYFLFGGLFLVLFVLEGFFVYRFVKSDKTDEAKKQGVYGALATYFGVLLFAFTVSLFRVIYYARYTVVLSGLLFFLVAFFMSSFCKKRFKALFASLFAVLFALSAISNFQVFYDESSHQLDNALKDEIVESDTFLFESIDGFVASASYPENTAYFYNREKWGVHEAYRAFGPDAYVIDSLETDEVNAISGRVWVVNRGDCYNKLTSLGYSEIEAHSINMRYHGTRFELILMDKTK